jgi:hypothetical protein
MRVGIGVGVGFAVVLRNKEKIEENVMKFEEKRKK